MNKGKAPASKPALPQGTTQHVVRHVPMPLVPRPQPPQVTKSPNFHPPAPFKSGMQPGRPAPAPQPFAKTIGPLQSKSVPAPQAIRQGPPKPALQPKTQLAAKPSPFQQPNIAAGPRPLSAPIQRHAGPGTRGVIQRLFSAGHAATFVAALNIPDAKWPAGELKWSWFQSQPGVTNALRDDKRWSEDEEGQEESKNALLEAARGMAQQAQARIARAAEEKARAEKLAAAKIAVTSALQQHIFRGDTDVGGLPTGYHSKAEASPTHEAYGTMTWVNEELGIYQQSVRLKTKREGAWVKKQLQSTFFPDTVGARRSTKDDVIFAVGTAMATMAKQVVYPEEWKGMTLTKIGDTWFPAGGEERKPE